MREIFESLDNAKSIIQFVLFMMVIIFVMNILGGVSSVFHTLTHPVSWFEKSKETLKEENANYYKLNTELEAKVEKLEDELETIKAEVAERYEQSWGEWVKGDHTRVDSLKQSDEAKKNAWF